MLLTFKPAFMKLNSFRIKYLIVGILTVAFFPSCNNKGNGVLIDEKSLSGYVIGREICHNNAGLDSWIVDFTFMNDQPQVGDTLTIQGVTYTNVVRVKGLDRKLQQPGLPIRVDYKVMTSAPVVPTDCNNPDANVYNLKELTIIFQFEIR